MSWKLCMRFRQMKKKVAEMLHHRRPPIASEARKADRSLQKAILEPNALKSSLQGKVGVESERSCLPCKSGLQNVSKRAILTSSQLR